MNTCSKSKGDLVIFNSITSFQGSDGSEHEQTAVQ